MKATKDMTVEEIRAELDAIESELEDLQEANIDLEDLLDEALELLDRQQVLKNALAYRGEKDYERWPL